MPTFIVAGRGRFPVDMLRYDEAYPVDGASAEALLTPEVPKAPVREAKLRSDRWGAPTNDRWASFGWTVTEVVR